MKQKSSIVLTLLSLIVTLFLSFNLNFSYAVSDNKVTICHATDSQSNPYVANQPNKSGDVSGHDDHNGPVWFPGITVKWGDIIPPFEYGDGQQYPGKNWTPQGQVIWNNGCNIPQATPTPTPIQSEPPECDGEFCPIPTPTFRPTPTPGGGGQIIGNIDLPCLFGCPTPTPTVTPTPIRSEPTATPTATPTTAPTTTPQPSNQGGETTTTTASSTGGSVLGATTTLAATGTFMDTVFNTIMTVGVLVMGLATVQYGKEKGY